MIEVTDEMQDGIYAVLFKDNWDGEGDVSYLLARLKDGKWFSYDSGKSLIEYVGDEILKYWPLFDCEVQIKTEHISVAVKRELFRFNSKQEWINKGRQRYANCDIEREFRIGIDSQGNVVHKGLCFDNAEEKGSYPIVVYELKTNWSDE